MSKINEFIFKSRAKIVFLVFLLLFCMCAFRLVQIQVVQGADYAKQALDSRTDIYNIKAKRGSILDYNGKVLANSVERYNIGVNQKVINQYKHYETVKDPSTGKQTKKLIGQGASEAAKQLSEILQVDPAELGGKMIGDKTFVYLAKDLSPQTWRKIKALGIYGIEPEKTMKREYPNQNTAGNVIGFVGSDDKGLAGLELTQNDKLTGKDGKGWVEIGPTGEAIPDGMEKVIKDVPGDNVKTTLRVDLQHEAEDAINQAVKKTGAQWGTAIVEEVGTGAIMALVDSGSVDPQNPAATPAENRGSRAVQNPYEPGSTIKLVTAAGALMQNKVQPTTTYTVPYQVELAYGQKFKDAFQHPTWVLTVAGIVAYSSNTGITQVGDTITDQSRYELLRKFGFGAVTGIELPGETSGILEEPKDWDGRQRYTTMFGQGFATTSLQVVSMFETIANDGVRSPVHVIDGYEKADGTYVKATHNKPIQVLDKQVSEELRKIMATVFYGGTKTLDPAKVPGYHLGGKTGTSEIYNSHGQIEGYINSLVVAVPIEKPKLVIGVMLYKPNSTWSGNTTAEPFTRILKSAVRQIKLEPVDSEPEVYPIRP